ncbi:hypothetical protein MHB46_21475 [Paenibacillus sp. FSL H7-0703]|uniref:hypothetical protein n=1 Tax=Paenibacillus sp. FSL H7-0703 TaxID=2921438 RepID=UPI0030F63639
MSVKDMTDQQINRSLAELMGYRVVNLNPEWWRNKAYWVLNEPSEERQHIGKGTEDEAWCEAPDYCNDPAASLEVQAVALNECPEEYIQALQETMWGRVYADMPNYRVAEMLNVSPRQRAEAAYMTLSNRD